MQSFGYELNNSKRRGVTGGGGGGGGGGSGETTALAFNPSRISAGQTLSLDNTISTQTSSYGSSQLLNEKTTGDWYVEFVVAAGANFIGIAKTDFNMGNQIGVYANSFAYYTAGGQIYFEGTVIATVAASTVYDVIGLAYTAGGGAGKGIKVYKNNVLIHTSTIYGTAVGTYAPAVTNNQTNASVYVANNIYNPPAGYTPLGKALGLIWSSNAAYRNATTTPINNGGRTLTETAFTYGGRTMATTGVASGSYYFEVLMVAGSGAIGLTPPTYSSVQQPGSLADSFGYFADTGEVLLNGTVVATVAASGAGVTIGIAFTVGGPVKLYRNNVLIHTTTGNFGTVGTVYRPAWAGRVSLNSSATLTNTYAVPAGYTKLWGVETVQASASITPTVDGVYDVYTFNASGTFTTTTAGAVLALVIAGGGAGGQTYGAGGAGGYLEQDVVTTPQTYAVTVGAGGAGKAFTGNNQSLASNNGNNSVFASITATGGGGGGSYSDTTATVARVGGSGGGGSLILGGNVAGAAGTSGQGFSGGSASATANFGGGGGGGASAVGQTGTTLGGGAGGAGVSSTITGTATTRGGGGGGASFGAGLFGAGGAGGGGAGASTGVNAAGIGVAGTANTGGGAGGSHSDGNTSTSAAGGSGVVIIRVRARV